MRKIEDIKIIVLRIHAPEYEEHICIRLKDEINRFIELGYEKEGDIIIYPGYDEARQTMILWEESKPKYQVNFSAEYLWHSFDREK